ncbi:EZH inhibitory protein [Acinonyx jubatus]|uniref:EZH inhibitory protein n=1 Tax=Acinonyx jubatus TaxID=32536 RepID=A0ABM3NDW0_ACIJB|nr:EZH inhibitory protein [Acinonyx jubatus]
MMVTPSSKEKAQKQQQGEMTAGPKNEITPAPGDARGTGNPSPGASAPSVSSDLSPLGGGAPHGVPGCLGRHFEHRRGSGAAPRDRGPHAELRRVVPQTGQGPRARVSRPHMRVAWPPWGEPRGALARPAGPDPDREPSELLWEGAARLGRGCPGSEGSAAPLFPGLPKPQCPVSLSPFSPGSQPSGRRRSRVSSWGHESRPGPALRSQARAAGPALRSQAARPGPAVFNGDAPPPGPAFRNHASGLGAAFCSLSSAPGPALRGGASVPGRALPRRHSSTSGPAFRRRASEPGPAAPRHRAPATGPAPRRRASATGPAPRRRAPATGPAPRRRASARVPAHSRRASAQVPAHSRRVSARGPAPTPASRGRASRPGPALRSPASGSGPALRSRANPLGPALHNGCTPPGYVLRSHPTQTSYPRSRPSLPVPTGLSPSPGLASQEFVSNSSSPNPEVPSLDTQPRWHAVRMRASSPSPPGRLFPFYGPSDEGSSSSSFPSSGSPGQSCCSTSTFSFSSLFSFSSPSSSSSSYSSSSSSSSNDFSDQCPSSPKFCGLGSISTPSPASLRRALLPEFEALSPVSSGQQVEIGSVPSPTTPPGV